MSSGTALGSQTRAFMERRFKHDFSHVRVHTDRSAAESARAIKSHAYTVRGHIAFDDGLYRPDTSRGRRLLAHELAHVRQEGHPAPGHWGPLILGSHDTVEREADGAAAAIASGTFPRVVNVGAPTLVRRQAQEVDAGNDRPPANRGNGVITLDQLIRDVQAVEEANPQKSPKEILTLVRSLYYGSPAGSPGFDRLIPDAPDTGAVEMCTDDEGQRCEGPVGVCTCTYVKQGKTQGSGEVSPKLMKAIRRLRMHADENASGDNPSPYVLVGDDVVDLGHVLVGADAVLHPRTDDPFARYGLTAAAGPATWEGDVGAAMVYLTEHQQTKQRSKDVKGQPAPTIEDYYLNSAPLSDVLGDVDAFGIAPLIEANQLSDAIAMYYLNESGGPPRIKYYRWSTFVAVNGLTYAASGDRVTFTAAARERVVTGITKFANLFALRESPITAMLWFVETSTWPDAPKFADRFLQDVKRGLEAELLEKRKKK